MYYECIEESAKVGGESILNINIYIYLSMYVCMLVCMYLSAYISICLYVQPSVYYLISIMFISIYPST